MRKNIQGKRVADGVVFSGPGIGCNAAWQIGAMRALLSEKLAGVRGVENAAQWRPDVFAGSVFGALNAAIFAQYADNDPRLAVDHLERIWKDDIAGPIWGPNGVFRMRGNPLPFLTPKSLAKDPWMPFTALVKDAAAISGNWATRMAKVLQAKDSTREAVMSFDMGVFLDPAPYRRTLKKHLDLPALREGSAELRVVATDWIAGNPGVFSQQDLSDAEGYSILTASAAIAILFPLVRIGGKPYAGGGDILRTPLTPAVEAVPANADEVHLHVLLSNPPIKEIPFQQAYGSLELFDRSYTMELEYITEHQYSEAGLINSFLRTMGEADEAVEELKKLETAKPKLAAAIADMLSVRRQLKQHYKPLNIHFYRPTRYQGATMEIFNFTGGRVVKMIDDGYHDTLAHDCKKEHCILL